MRKIKNHTLLVILLFSLLGKGEADSWWNSRWNRRCRLRIEGKNTTVINLPIIITGREIKNLAGSENVSLGSLRIVSGNEEIPVQVDEFDNGILPAVSPNHILDDNDQLVFQVTIPSSGIELWLYWSTEPLPPPAYPCRIFSSVAMDPEIYQHDFQMWNDDVFLGLRGPARGHDSTRNSMENWGAGCLVWLDFFRKPVLHFRHSWSSIFPLGAICSSPGPDASGWQHPQLVAAGPVRVAAGTSLSAATVKTSSGEFKVDVQHLVWLYEKPAIVCFEEFILPVEEGKNFRQEFSFGFSFSGQAGEFLWYSQKGKSFAFTPEAESLRLAEEGKIIASCSDLEDWFAFYSSQEKTGYAYFLKPAEQEEKRQNDFYSRKYGSYRCRRFFSSLPEKKLLVTRVWVAGLKEAEISQVQCFHSFLVKTAISFGQVEKR